MPVIVFLDMGCLQEERNETVECMKEDKVRLCSGYKGSRERGKAIQERETGNSVVGKNEMLPTSPCESTACKYVCYLKCIPSFQFQFS